MMIVSVHMPISYADPVPLPGWTLAEVVIDCPTVHAFRQKITDKVGPRQAAGIVEGTFDRVLALLATIKHPQSGETKTARWVVEPRKHAKPGWSEWK